MSFASLIGNDHNKRILQRLLERGQPGMTLIFAGPDGVGKRQFALTMAKVANCQRPVQHPVPDNCDECPVCRRIDAGTFGDVTVIGPDGAYIKIAQTRELAEEVQFRPREGRQRFFIIDEADRLREEAANSLLKTLEEPPSTSTIILITSRPDALLVTIRSRAQRLNFRPLSMTAMEAYLTAHYKRPAADTALLARVTGGRIGQATAIDISEYRRERREIIGLIELIAAGSDRFRLLKAAEYFGKQERDEFERKIDLMTQVLRDIFLLATGAAPESVINFDVLDRLEPLARNTGTARLTGWVAGFDRLRAGLRINLNRQLATEAMLMELATPAAS